MRDLKRSLGPSIRSRLANIRRRMNREFLWKMHAYSQYPLHRVKYRAIAHPFKVVYIDPSYVRAQLRKEGERRKQWPWGSIKGGCWDEEVNYRYDKEDIAYRSMCQHFNHGVPWEDTSLFTEKYPSILASQGATKGCHSLAQLIDYYRLRIDPLYYDVKENGLRTPLDPEIDPIFIYIGRNGQIIYSADGNHRLHVAKLLGVRVFPVLVRMRHLRWQVIREAIKANEVEKCSLVEYRNHPDLQDLY